MTEPAPKLGWPYAPRDSDHETHDRMRDAIAEASIPDPHLPPLPEDLPPWWVHDGE